MNFILEPPESEEATRTEHNDVERYLKNEGYRVDPEVIIPPAGPKNAEEFHAYLLTEC
jgi:hypothetical protein